MRSAAQRRGWPTARPSATVSGRTGPIAPSAEGGGCPGDGGHLPGAAQPAARPQRSPGTPAGPPTITPIHPVSAHQAQAPTGVPFVDVTGVCVPSTPASATSMRHDVVVTRDGHGGGAFSPAWMRVRWTGGFPNRLVESHPGAAAPGYTLGSAS